MICFKFPFFEYMTSRNGNFFEETSKLEWLLGVAVDLQRRDLKV